MCQTSCAKSAPDVHLCITMTTSVCIETSRPSNAWQNAISKNRLDSKGHNISTTTQAAFFVVTFTIHPAFTKELHSDSTSLLQLTTDLSIYLPEEHVHIDHQGNNSPVKRKKAFTLEWRNKIFQAVQLGMKPRGCW